VLLDKRAGLINVHGIVLDFRAWPIAQVTPPPYSVSDDALMEFMAVHKQVVRSMPSPHALILDLRGLGHMSTHQRKKLTGVLHGDEDEFASLCAGTALVFSSPVVRGMLSAVFWFFKPPYPVKVVPDLVSARAWVSTLVPTSLEKTA